MKLPPLPQEAFDGKKFEATIPKLDALPNRCKHKNAKLTDRELRCPCGASWSGPNIAALHALLTC